MERWMSFLHSISQLHHHPTSPPLASSTRCSSGRMRKAAQFWMARAQSSCVSALFTKASCSLCKSLSALTAVVGQESAAISSCLASPSRSRLVKRGVGDVEEGGVGDSMSGDENVQWCFAKERILRRQTLKNFKNCSALVLPPHPHNTLLIYCTTTPPLSPPRPFYKNILPGVEGAVGCQRDALVVVRVAVARHGGQGLVEQLEGPVRAAQLAGQHAPS